VFYCQPCNKVAMTHPAAVTACNLDLENLITGKKKWRGIFFVMIKWLSSSIADPDPRQNIMDPHHCQAQELERIWRNIKKEREYTVP
jgi:hypothetical protein